MKKRMAKVSVVCLLLLMAVFWTVTVSYNARAVPRDKRIFRTISMTAGVDATADQLFTVTGGPIEIVSMFGQVTTIIASTPGNVSIILDSAIDPNYDADFSIVVALANGSLGDVITFGAITSAENAGILAGNKNAAYPLSWFCPVGEIEQKLSGTGSGAVKWYMTYRRLDPASRAVISSE